jgi:hypothetical protein
VQIRRAQLEGTATAAAAQASWPARGGDAAAWTPPGHASSDDDGSEMAAPVTNALHLLSSKRKQRRPADAGLRPAVASAPTRIDNAAAHRDKPAPPPQRPAPAGPMCRVDMSGVIRQLGAEVDLAPACAASTDAAAQPAGRSQPVDLAAAPAASAPASGASEEVQDSRKKKPARKRACFPYGNYHRYACQTVHLFTNACYLNLKNQ